MRYGINNLPYGENVRHSRFQMGEGRHINIVGPTSKPLPQSGAEQAPDLVLLCCWLLSIWREAECAGWIVHRSLTSLQSVSSGFAQSPLFVSAGGGFCAFWKQGRGVAMGFSLTAYCFLWKLTCGIIL